MDSKHTEKTFDRIIYIDCKGITSSAQTVEVPLETRTVEVVRICYYNDAKEIGYSQLKCSTLLGADICGVFSDNVNSNDVGYIYEHRQPTIFSGQHTFTWNVPTGGARAGKMYIHLRFRG